MKPSLTIVANIKIPPLEVQDARAGCGIDPSSQRACASPAQPTRSVGVQVNLLERSVPFDRVRVGTPNCWMLCITLLFAPFAYSQTTVIANKTDSELVVGADSKATDASGNPLPNIEKILPIGLSSKAFVAVVGLYDMKSVRDVINLSLPSILSTNTPPDFSIPSIAATCGLGWPSIFGKAENCTMEARHQLPFILRAINKTKPDYYRKKIANKLFLTLIFFGIDTDDSLVYYVRDFYGPTDPSSSAEPRIDPTDCGKGCVGFTLAGHHEAIDGVLSQHPDYWKSGIAQAIRRLIQIEIDDCPAKVGPPIRIKHIANGYAYWEPEPQQPTEEKAPEALKPPPTRARRKTRRRSRKTRAPSTQQHRL